MFKDLIGATTPEVYEYVCKENWYSAGQVCLLTYGEVGYSKQQRVHVVPAESIKPRNPESEYWVDTLRTKALKPTDYLAITSMMLSRSGNILHLPMLDYDPNFNWYPELEGDVPAQLQQAKGTLRELGFPPTAILNSGTGFHCLGLVPLWDRGFNRLQSLLDHKIETESEREADHNIDGLWLLSSQKCGYLALRLAAGEKKPVTPKVVDIYLPAKSQQWDRKSLVGADCAWPNGGLGKLTSFNPHLWEDDE